MPPALLQTAAAAALREASLRQPPLRGVVAPGMLRGLVAPRGPQKLGLSLHISSSGLMLSIRPMQGTAAPKQVGHHSPGGCGLGRARQQPHQRAEPQLLPFGGGKEHSEVGLSHFVHF